MTINIGKNIYETYKNTLFIQFSDGQCFFGEFYLYENDDKDYQLCWTANRLINCNTGKFKFIKPMNSKFIYTTSAIVKFCDMEEEQFEAYKRDINLDQILN